MIINIDKIRLGNIFIFSIPKPKEINTLYQLINVYNGLNETIYSYQCLNCNQIFNTKENRFISIQDEQDLFSCSIECIGE